MIPSTFLLIVLVALSASSTTEARPQKTEAIALCKNANLRTLFKGYEDCVRKMREEFLDTSLKVRTYPVTSNNAQRTFETVTTDIWQKEYHAFDILVFECSIYFLISRGSRPTTS